MLTKEESKIKLGKLFGDITNDVMTRILDDLSFVSVRESGPSKTSVENDMRCHDYGPFLIKDYHYLMTVRKYMHKSYMRNGGQEIYREIRFNDDISGDEYEKYKSFGEGYKLPTYKACKISISPSHLSLEGVGVDYMIDENYEPICTTTAPHSTVEYNIKDNKFFTSGTLTLNELERVVNNVPFYEFDSNALDAQFNATFPNHPFLGNPKGKSKISLMFSDDPRTTIQLLSLCSAYPNLWYLFSDERILKNYVTLITTKFYKWDPASFAATLNMNGRTPSEILGLSDVMVDYAMEAFGKTIYVHDYQKHLVALRGLSNLAGITTIEDVEYLRKLLPDNSSLEGSLKNISYLLNCGFSLKDIYLNVRKIYDKQNLEFGDCLESWHELIRIRELFQGNRVKYVPKNIASEKAVYSRSLMKMPTHIRELFIHNIKNIRRGLAIKTKQFEIIPVVDICYSKDEFENNASNIKYAYSYGNFTAAHTIASMTDKGLLLQEIQTGKRLGPVLNKGKVQVTSYISSESIHGGYEHIINDSLHGTDYLLYRKGNNDKFALLKVEGDGIIASASELGPIHIKHLEEWVLKNRMILVLKD